jgi:hypothetical protein
MKQENVMQLLSYFVTEDFLATLRALLLEIQHLASVLLDAGYEVLAVILA